MRSRLGQSAGRTHAAARELPAIHLSSSAAWLEGCGPRLCIGCVLLHFLHNKHEIDTWAMYKVHPGPRQSCTCSQTYLHLVSVKKGQHLHPNPGIRVAGPISQSEGIHITADTGTKQAALLWVQQFIILLRASRLGIHFCESGDGYLVVVQACQWSHALHPLQWVDDTALPSTDHTRQPKHCHQDSPQVKQTYECCVLAPPRYRRMSKASTAASRP
jgi:hypothetical protein